MKKTKRLILLTIFLVFLISHSTPQLAVRTHVIFMGHPIVALKTGMTEDHAISIDDLDKYKRMNAKVYKLTKPPVERATDGLLRRYLVKKVGFLYFAEFIGEG